MKDLYIIACISRDNGLGKDGQLLWHLADDMKFFKTTTTNSAVIMGRKTFDSIGRPLPNRQNIILSTQLPDTPGTDVYHSKTDLDQFFQFQPGPKFIIGGASLYKMYLDEAEKLYLTEVNATKPADTFFPEFSHEKFTKNILQSHEQDGIKYQIVEYTRKP